MIGHHASPTRRTQIDDLYRTQVPEQPTISPDGHDVVYVLSTVDRDADRPRHALWHVSVDSAARALSDGPADTSPAYSPDGTLIAFLRPGAVDASGPGQLWTMPSDGGPARQLTDLPGGAGRPVWSPGGDRIAFAAIVGAAGPTEPVVVDRLGYKSDGTGLLRGGRCHLHVLDLDSGAVRQITDGDWHASDPAWSPDGTLLAFAAGRDTDADLTLRSAAYVLTPEPGARPRRVGPATGTAGPVSFTADGRALLVVGDSEVRVGNASLWRVPLNGPAGGFGGDEGSGGDGGDGGDGAAAGRAIRLAADLDRNVMPGGPAYPGGLPQLDDSGERVLLCVRDRGDTHLYRAAADGAPGTEAVIGEAGHVVAGLAVASRADRAAVVLATPRSYGEVAVLDLASGERTVLTDHGASLSDVDLFPRQSRDFTISDGTVVQGWLIHDPAQTAAGPLLLDVHGGPHNAWNGAVDPVHLYHQVLVAQGWTVLIVNPRASDGYGDAFFRAGVGGWGTADAADLTEPIDQVIAEGLADPNRLAVTGYSYGGYMTCYLTGHTDRFAAAVAGGVVADLHSMYGTSDIGHGFTQLEAGGTPADVPEQYSASSPIVSAGNVTTPTLILHGDADDRCPVGQAEQWFTELRSAGVPTRMVRYPGGSHLFIINGRPSHRADYQNRLMGWLRRYIDGPTVAATRVEIDPAHWQRRLQTLIARHRVPGAALGILRMGTGGAPDEAVTCAAGVLNSETGVPATPDSVFQIGSITKVWTTTLVMQLVDEGLIDLDAPIVEVLPELRLSDPDVTAAVTMRHLLTHTSGIDGDVFTDTGRGDDCLARYVELLADAAQNHPLGATFSYCNSGFVVAGRVIEKLTGLSWDEALAKRVIAPLGLTRTVTLPEQALRLRAAAGHVPGDDPDADPTLAPVWGIPRSSGPAGCIVSDVAGVLAFARMHLTGGSAPDGTRLLAEASTVAMQQQHAELPDVYSLGDSWGLGWMRFGWGSHRLFGHDGNTIGQSAFLRILPEQNLAVTLLTNGGHTNDLYQDLYREIFAELAGVAMPRPLEPLAAGSADGSDGDITPWLGRYERSGERIEILRSGDGRTLRSTSTGGLADWDEDPVHEYELLRAGLPAPDGEPSTALVPGDVFVIRPPGTRTYAPVTFYRLPTGEQYLHHHGRATPLRESDPERPGTSR
jgi:dipeptidyl aminopeptidase/acylaminoacyl peptidase/CubicO group peptidase (beta-lactamase class C family)